MKAQCPQCGYQVDFAEHARSLDMRDAMLLLPIFGKDARLVFEYAQLFGVTPLSLKTGKLLRILMEVASGYASGKFISRKKTYSISPQGIGEALKIVCNRSFSSPLTNHNYLKQIMIGIAEREAQERSRADEKRLRQREERIKEGHRPDPDANLAGVKDLLKEIG